jgi:AraC family transcriptional regulator, exoenzyme S synthesis regulatory protein ExsA
LYNLYSNISTNTRRSRRFSCGETLLTIFNCGLKNKFQDLWSHHNYIIYVIEGRKIWHTPHGSYDLHEGSCVFVRKGAGIVEQFFDTEFCFFLFFVPDEFICDVLKKKSIPVLKSEKKYEPIISIETNSSVQAFYQSMMVYFDSNTEPDPSLLELKFRELILTIADNLNNREIASFFSSLLRQPQYVSLQKVMEDNYCFNLKLEEFARLSSRSLSAFKRDFMNLYHISPGKWLLEKRLTHALHMLSNMGRTVSEAAFESGFESPSHFSRSFRQRFGASPASLKLQIAV